MPPTSKKNLAGCVAALGRKVFTSGELAAVSGRSASVVSQGLGFMRRQGLVVNVGHGLWAAGAEPPGQYEVVPYLLPKQRVYVSFTSALHLHGVIDQIPQVITLASVSHSMEITTSVGSFRVHHLSPEMFCGFEWHGKRDFLLAEPEKAMVDCLYVSAFRKRQFSHFPELDLRGFSFKKAAAWVGRIKSVRAAAHVSSRLAELKNMSGVS
jgi:predicted transcriptional regulator of viral defense system